MIIKTLKFFSGSAATLVYSEHWFNYGYCRRVDTMEEADFVLFHGTSNISPEYLNEEEAPYNKISIVDPAKCEYEISNLKRAIDLKKPILAIEKGMHLVNVHLGGKMVSHMQHPLIHKITNYDGSTIRVPSRHNQIIKPYSLKYDSYKIISYSESLSHIYLDAFSNTTMVRSNSNNKNEEIESIFFKDINALCFQYNPALTPRESKVYKQANKLTKLFLRGKLEGILALSIPLDMVDPHQFDFNKDEYNKLDHLRIKTRENLFSN